MKKIPHDLRSFNEVNATYELFLLTCKVRECGKMTPEIADKISVLKKEIKFEKLSRARREYETSDKPSSSWPQSLQGRSFCEWECIARKALGMDIPLHLKVSCADFIKEKKAMDTESVALNEI
jgi:hypothetical protein